MNMESIIADWLNGDADELPWQYHERHYMWRGERVRVLYHWQHGEIARA